MTDSKEAGFTVTPALITMDETGFTVEYDSFLCESAGISVTAGKSEPWTRTEIIGSKLLAWSYTGEDRWPEWLVEGLNKAGRRLCPNG